MKKFLSIALIICFILVNVPAVFAGFEVDADNEVLIDMNSILSSWSDGTVIYSDTVNNIADVLGDGWSLYTGGTPSKSDTVSVKEIDGKKYLNIAAAGKGNSCGIVRTLSPSVSEDGKYVAEIEYYGGDTYTANVYTTLADSNGNNIVTIFKDNSNYFRIRVGNSAVQNMYRSKNVITAYNMKFTVDMKNKTLDIDLSFGGGGRTNWADEDTKLSYKTVNGAYNVTRSEPYHIEMADGGSAVPSSFAMYIVPNHETFVRPASLGFVKITPYVYVQTTCTGAYRENGEILDTITTKEKRITLRFDDEIDTSALNPDNIKIYDRQNNEVSYAGYEVGGDKKSYTIVLGDMSEGSYTISYSNLTDAKGYAVADRELSFNVERAVQLNISKDSLQVSNSSENNDASETVKFDRQSGMTVFEYTWKTSGQPTTAQRAGTRLMSGDDVIMDIYSAYRQISISAGGKTYTVPSSAVVFYTGTYSVKAIIDNKNHLADVILTNPNVDSYVIGTDADFESKFTVDKDSKTITLKGIALPEYEADGLDFYVSKLTAEGMCTTDISNLKIYEPSVFNYAKTYSDTEVKDGENASTLMEYIDFSFDFAINDGVTVKINGKEAETETGVGNVLRVKLPKLVPLQKYDIVFENLTDKNMNAVIGLEKVFSFVTTKSPLFARFAEFTSNEDFVLEVNNEYASDKNIVILCAVYSSDGRLKAQPQIAGKKVSAVSSERFSDISFTLPSGSSAGDIVRIMVWDGEDSMHPLVKSEKIVVK